MSTNLVSKVLRQGLFTRVVGRKISYFQELSSTMDEATRQAREGVVEGAVILAEEQTSSRGRFQRTWVSQAGNLYLSIVLRPSLRSLTYLSIISALAVVRAIRKTTTLEPTIKWPNDIRVGGKKVSGILIENAIQDNAVQYAIVGIGINVVLDTSAIEELKDIATSLAQETDKVKVVEREALLRQLLHEMDRLYLPLRERSAKTPSNSSNQVFENSALARAKEEWRGLLETLGSHVQVQWKNEVYTGFAEDVDEIGNLLLRQRDGTLMSIPAGEVISAREVVKKE